ncbi:hypothetical protein LXL04_007503 [Taraxacum kok-saghyz]
MGKSTATTKDDAQALFRSLHSAYSAIPTNLKVPLFSIHLIKFVRVLCCALTASDNSSLGLEAQLRQAIAKSQAELASICASLGDPFLPIMQIESGSLTKELAAIFPQVEMMQKKKNERKVQFIEVLEQIQNLSKELSTSTEDKSCFPILDESDLSLRRLEELKIELHTLEKEKSDRLKKVMEYLASLDSLCGVLGMNVKNTIIGIHPNLENPGTKKSISLDTIERRMQRLSVKSANRNRDLIICKENVLKMKDYGKFRGSSSTNP